MIQTYLQPLAHGITLSCRASGQRGRPVLLFLHGFPEGAFVWDALLEHFALPENGAYRCVAPNLRGFEQSSAPAELKAYRPKYLVQDIEALIAIETGHDGQKQGQLGCQLAALVAHDWGGAVAWNLINQMPHLARQLVIINSPHPGTFLRELQSSPQQQAASAYMNFLVRPDAESLLAQNDFAMLWQFLIDTDTGKVPTEVASAASPPTAPSSDLVAANTSPSWLTDAVKDQYRAVWRHGLTGGCNLYRASPLRPATASDPGANAVSIPHAALAISLPTLVIWGMNDTALRAELIDGLVNYIAKLTLRPVADASHWIVHENPGLVIDAIQKFLK